MFYPSFPRRRESSKTKDVVNNIFFEGRWIPACAGKTVVLKTVLFISKLCSNFFGKNHAHL
jgi:hypothetical protein